MRTRRRVPVAVLAMTMIKPITKTAIIGTIISTVGKIPWPAGAGRGAGGATFPGGTKGGLAIAGCAATGTLCRNQSDFCTASADAASKGPGMEPDNRTLLAALVETAVAPDP